jgi:hypothetical protein
VVECLGWLERLDRQIGSCTLVDGLERQALLGLAINWYLLLRAIPGILNFR